MIPKKIHYFWFGKNPKNNKIKDCLATFEILKNSGYEVIEWNEDNYDIYKNDYTRHCYENKKWAHLSDFARLDILHEYGGIYLDADIEVVKKFDDLLNYSFVIGFMFDCNLGTAVICSEKGNDIISDLLNRYLTDKINLDAPNNDLLTTYFINHVQNFKLNGQEQTLGRIKVLPKDRFEQPSFLKKNNYTIHHFTNTWREVRFRKQKEIIFSIIGLYLYRKMLCYKALKISPFYEKYKLDSQ